MRTGIRGIQLLLLPRTVLRSPLQHELLAAGLLDLAVTGWCFLRCDLRCARLWSCGSPGGGRRIVGN